MKVVATVLLAMLLLAIESVVTKYLGMAVTRIDVTVVIVVFLALRAGTLEGAFSSYAIGYLLDLMSGRPTGLYTFLAVLLFLLCRLAASLVDARSARTFSAFVIAATAGHGLLAAFFTWLSSQGGAATALSALPVQVILTFASSWVLYPLLNRLGLSQERQEPGFLR
jgi:hypothetical protein